MILDDESQTGVSGDCRTQVAQMILDDESQTGVFDDCRWHR